MVNLEIDLLCVTVKCWARLLSGFLSLEDPKLDLPGNAGLKDQVLALKWVKNNCSRFGGDANNITVFGESAGAASTHYMMLTEQTKNLFHKAILMSGSAVAPWANVPSRNWAYRLAKQLGYDDIDNDEKIYNFLRNAKGSKILDSERQILSLEERRNHYLFPFGPIVEPFVTDHCVVPEPPVLMMRKAWSANIPIVIGGTSFEGLIFMKEAKRVPHIINTLTDCEVLVPVELNLDRDSPKCKEYGLKLKATYFDNEDPSIDQIYKYLDLMSYKFFWHPIHRAITSRLAHGSGSNYLYRFDFDSKTFNMLRIFICGPKVRGTCHGDDLLYLFLTGISPVIEKTSPEYKMIEQFIGMLTTFAQTGNPNCPEIPDINWQALNSSDEHFQCLNLSGKHEIIPLPEHDKNLVWKKFYSENVFI